MKAMQLFTFLPILKKYIKLILPSGVKFDVIVTDPPYGIREQMTKVGTDKDYSKSSIPEEYLKTHVPEKVSYSLEHILEV